VKTEKGRIAILGLGLMGGSLGLALKARGVCGCVAGYARRPGLRKEALARGAVDEVYAEPSLAVAGADRVVLCVPVRAMPGLLEQALPGLAPGAVVTDVGSTKRWVSAELNRRLVASGASFVGAHPLAGSEQQGLASARADLYDSCLCVLTPDGAPAGAVRRVRQLWRAVGARVQVLSAPDHDAAVARTSHAPHLASAALARLVSRARGPGARVSGPGLRDMTRLAEGSPEVWRDIVWTNREAILEALDSLSEDLSGLRRIIRKGKPEDVLRWLRQAQRARRRLADRRPDFGPDET
jgi:cyclohexadieny/prephenate dehydrogenase